MALLGLHHLHLRVSNMTAMRAFTADFGLVETSEQEGRVYLRGAGQAAYHVVLEEAAESALAGIAFEVDGDGDLERAIQDFGASGRHPLYGPGGGVAVDLVDPEGLRVSLVTGIKGRQPDALPPSMIFNQGRDKTRQGVFQQKVPLGPPSLLRLGHVGLFIRDWQACDHWYREVLGLIPSDLLFAGPPQNVVGGFYRIDRGQEWVDHHCVAFFQMGKSDLHHASFEVQNPEVQFLAHRWLQQRAHEGIWGVGRHPLGSHVFDVWRTPSGHRFETFSDTDVLNADQPTERHPIAEAQMDLWSDKHVDAYFA